MRRLAEEGVGCFQSTVGFSVLTVKDALKGRTKITRIAPRKCSLCACASKKRECRRDAGHGARRHQARSLASRKQEVLGPPTDFFFAPPVVGGKKEDGRVSS